MFLLKTTSENHTALRVCWRCVQRNSLPSDEMANQNCLSVKGYHSIVSPGRKLLAAGSQWSQASNGAQPVWPPVLTAGGAGRSDRAEGLNPTWLGSSLQMSQPDPSRRRSGPAHKHLVRPLPPEIDPPAVGTGD